MKLFPEQIYTNRRQAITESLNSGIILFLGNTETPMNYPANTYKFRQDSNFLYFFGLTLPSLAAIIDIENQSCCIYENDIDIDDIIWMGPQPTIRELAEKVGIKETKPFSALETDINTAKNKGRQIHYLPPYRSESKIFLNKLLNIPVENLKEKSSVEAVKAVVRLREIKDEYEIREMEIAAEIGYEMHFAGMSNARKGIFEKDIAGMVEGIALSGGGSVSFPVICSIRGEILHNHYHGNILNKGDLLLLDAGAETEMHYCSDYTRTFPVSGTFSTKQKEIYQIVLDANNKAFKLVKEGVFYKDIHLAASKVIAKGLKEVGLIKGDIDEVVEQGAHALFFPHGLGHMIGLDVHDMEDLGENLVGYNDEVARSEQFGTAYVRLGKKLQKGFALTIEPGIYFIPALIAKWKEEKKFEQFINYHKVEKYIGFGGIRLEDDVLVTDKGAKYIGKRLPVSIKDIEKVMNS